MRSRLERLGRLCSYTYKEGYCPNSRNGVEICKEPDELVV
jgi:hypothetical protein